MPAFFFEVYSGRTPTDGGVIEAKKNVRRVGAVRFAVTTTPSSTATTFILKVRESLDKHPVLKNYKITGQHLSAAISDISDPSAGAYSQRIGKHVYGYRIGFASDIATAKANSVFKNFK